MKKQFVSPEVKLLNFEAEDILTASDEEWEAYAPGNNETPLL